MPENAKPNTTEATTTVFRLSYPSIFKPTFNKLSKKMEYSCEAVFEPGDTCEGLKAAAKNAARKLWGDDETKWPELTYNPFHDQKEKAKEKDGKMVMPNGYTAGAIFMRFKSETKPTVVDQNVNELMEEHKLYAGCYVKANVNASAFPKPGVKGVKPGISFYLNAIQLVKDGEAFSGRPRVEDAFTPISTENGGKDATSLF